MKKQIKQALEGLALARTRHRQGIRATASRALTAREEKTHNLIAQLARCTVRDIGLHMRVLPDGSGAYLLPVSVPLSGADTLKIQRRLRYAKHLSRKNSLQAIRLGLEASASHALDTLAHQGRSASLSARQAKTEATQAWRKGGGMECGPTLVKGSPSARRGMTHIIPRDHGAVCPMCRAVVHMDDIETMGTCPRCSRQLHPVMAQRRYEGKARERQELLPHRLDGPIQSREWRTHDWDRPAGKYINKLERLILSLPKRK